MKYAEIDIMDLICQQLKKQQRSKSWLATHLFKDVSCFCKMFKKDDISIKLLKRISYLLDYDFFEILSNEHKERKQNQI